MALSSKQRQGLFFDGGWACQGHGTAHTRARDRLALAPSAARQRAGTANEGTRQAARAAPARARVRRATALAPAAGKLADAGGTQPTANGSLCPALAPAKERGSPYFVALL